jgi:hypothetical protein
MARVSSVSNRVASLVKLTPRRPRPAGPRTRPTATKTIGPVIERRSSRCANRA